MMRSAVQLLLTSALLAANGVADSAVPPVCPPGRFIVQGAPLLGFGADDSDAVTITGADPATATVGTATGCAPNIVTRMKATRKGTLVKVQWPFGCGIWNRK